MKFALLGAAGFIAPRHVAAIHATGGDLVAACDPHDSVGYLDRYFPRAAFFTEVERFDRHLSNRSMRAEGVDVVSVCTPNYLHDAHARLGLRLGADVVLEKPAVVHPRNLDHLERLEGQSGCRIHTVLQLRLHPQVQALRQRFTAPGPRAMVDLDYVTRRGAWYQHSWKGDSRRSGGLGLNIGIHLFDLLLHLFGAPTAPPRLSYVGPSRLTGELVLDRADVRFRLSTMAEDLPPSSAAQGWHAHRVLRVDDEVWNLGKGFEDLHTEVYQSVLAGTCTGLADARPAIEFVNRLREQAGGAWT